TEGLLHARARILAWFLDGALHRIDSTEASSELALTGGSWQPVSLSLRGNEQAVWVQLELQLVQPVVYDQRPRGIQEVWQEDSSGAAWFDDISISQVPRVDIRTMSPCNIVVEPEQPDLAVLVRDFAGESLGLSLGLYDIDGREVAAETF